VGGRPVVEITVPTPEHVVALAETMRPEDAAEVRASGGYSPVRALWESLVLSTEAYALLFDHQVAAIWGVVQTQPRREGVAWMMSGRVVLAHRREFLRLSKVVLRDLLQRYPVLWNFIDARYEAALRWAQWLGGELRAAVPHGLEQRPFHPVVFRRGHV
jgi:hypothetical protein